MDARNDILNVIRSNLPRPVDLPSLDGPWLTYDDPHRQFCDTLQAVGGRALSVSTMSEVQHHLEELPAWTQAETIYSMIPQIDRTSFSLDAIHDPHQLRHLDFAVLRGEFAVAENAAVWVTDQHLKHRIAFFIPQHLALVVPASQIVHNMHQAYERLPLDAPGFGAFISGPSKTADIEQSLVIGAHGPRSLTVFLVDSDG